ncbi:peroxiredoxin [Castellaniella sp.]|uniref:peroxiredoxin n=1 Tax=Castellaniella sp. TaxID=1955812 RepID=UPI002AFDFD04|nr:peroxiredoxin [Castellaniella sp.]
MTSVAIGQALPAFQADSTHGPVDSSALRGTPFVLYFYPKDNTPGCTTESQDFRDLHDQFQALGCHVYGISRDSLKSHENFTDKQSLPFPLISDPDEALCGLFDVMKLKNMYGKQVRGIDRSTFLIDRSGILVQEWRGVRVPGHAAEVLQAARNLAA